MSVSHPHIVASPKKRAPYGSSSNRRSQRKADTRQRLLSAGCKLFLESGYEAATIDQIAAQAGVSRAAFYLHFESKSDIIHTLADDVADGLRACYEILRNLGPEPSLGAVAGWVQKFVDTCRAEGAMAMMLQRTMLHPDRDLVDEIAYYDELMHHFGSTYPRFATTKSDPAARAEAQLFFFQLLALIRQIYAGEERLDWDEICVASARTFLTFIHGGG